MHELVIRGGNIVDGTGAPRFVGDVAIDDGVITAVGVVDEPGEREVDATGLAVMPGWVDIHTHYDGQVTWDPQVTPSSWHGVTTVVMGNCGVGFAPVRPDGHDFLIELMESVEDIPGTALHEGHGLAVGVVPRVPRRARLDGARARHRRPGPARRAARLRDGRTSARRRHRRRDRRDGAAHPAGAGRRRGRLLHLAHDAAPLEARPDPGHPRTDRRADGDRRRGRRRRPRRLPADRRRVAGRRGRRVHGRDRPPQRSDGHLLARAVRAGPARLPRRARGCRRGAGRRAERRAAGGLPPDRHDVRPAVVAASVHHPSDLPTTQHAPARRARRRAPQRPRPARRCSPRSHRRAARSPSS